MRLQVQSEYLHLLPSVSVCFWDVSHKLKIYHIKTEQFYRSIVFYASHWHSQLCLYIGTRLRAEQIVICIGSMKFSSFKAGLLGDRCCLWIRRKLMMRLGHSRLTFSLVQAFSIVNETTAREMVPLRRQTIFSAERESAWGSPRGHTFSSYLYSCISKSCISIQLRVHIMDEMRHRIYKAQHLWIFVIPLKHYKN